MPMLPSNMVVQVILPRKFGMTMLTAKLLLARMPAYMPIKIPSIIKPARTQRTRIRSIVRVHLFMSLQVALLSET